MRNRSAKWTMLVMGMLVLASCTGRKKLITSGGIHALKLGEQVPGPEVEKLKGVPMRDTLLEDGDYMWRAALLQYKNGLVYLEEDFHGSEALNRIRIETPDLRLKNGLKVGKIVADLREASSTWYIVPLPQFKLFDFYSRKMPRVHFLVDDPSHDFTEKDWKKYSMDQFDAQAKVVAIVIH